MSRGIEAAVIGYRVPDAFRATVHSVFHATANLVVEGLDHLLTLIVSDSINLPQGIRLSVGETDAIQRLEPGQEMVCRDGAIRSAGYPYEIDLCVARKYDGSIRLKALGQNMDHSYQTTLDLLAKRQSEKQTGLRIMDLVHILKNTADTEMGKPVVIHHLVDLLENTRRLDLDEAAASVHTLVGLGGGLTPTGDDVLVGYLAGLRASVGEDAERMEWIGRLSAGIRVASKATNDISRTYLILAADGQFSSSLKNLATSICAGEPEDSVGDATEIAFQVGHSSGMDAATGLLAGLAAWQDGLIPNSTNVER